MKIELDKKNLEDVYLDESDKLEITYVLKPPFVNLKKSLVYWKLNKNPNFKLLSLTQPNVDEIIVTVEAVHAQIIVATIVVAVSAILVSYFLFGSIKSVYKITKDIPKLSIPLIAGAIGILGIMGIVIAKR